MSTQSKKDRRKAGRVEVHEKKRRLLGIEEALRRCYSGDDFYAWTDRTTLEQRAKLLGLPCYVGDVYLSLADPRDAVGDAKADWAMWLRNVRTAIKSARYESENNRAGMAWRCLEEACRYARLAIAAWHKYRATRDAYRTLPALWVEE